MKKKVVPYTALKHKLKGHVFRTEFRPCLIGATPLKSMILHCLLQVLISLLVWKVTQLELVFIERESVSEESSGCVVLRKYNSFP